MLTLALCWFMVSAYFVMDRSWHRRIRLALILVICLAWRIILALLLVTRAWPSGWNTYLAGATRFDAFVYHDYALQLAAQNFASYGPWQGLNYQGIVYFYAPLYALFGSSVAHAVIANCLATFFASICLFKLLTMFSREATAARAAVVLLMLPELTLWSSMPLKEAVVTSLFVFGLMSVAKFVARAEPRWVVGAVVSIWLLLELRVVVALIVVVTLVVSTLCKPKGSSRGVILAVLAVCAIVSLAAVSRSTLIRDYGSPFSIEFFRKYTQTFNERPDELNASTPATSLGVLTKGAFIEGKLYFIPVRLVLFYLNPPPWVSGYGLWDPFRMASAMFVWVALPAAVVGTYRWFRRRLYSNAVLVPFVVGSIVVSSATPFLDDRLRTMLMPLFIAAAFWGWETQRKWWYVYLLIIPSMALAVVGYYVFKTGARTT